jgi:coenzyme F420-reducing hydrogenase beta subunit
MRITENKIKLAEKQICTGCAACYSVCPVQCISMKEDEEGFLFPIIDEEKCAQCSLCEKICPVIFQGKERKPLNVYAVKNPNEEIRLQSSSGGIFTLLAEHIINNGGVVFGARFNEDWEVVHDYTETIEGIEAFRGSKYVQSRIGDMFKTAKDFLETGRNVLFSGTPCQIAGLKAFLQRDYDNLLTVDLVCHGVPSPLVWKKYLCELIDILLPPPPNPTYVKYNSIIDIKFRDKTYGWEIYNFVIHFSLKMPVEDYTKISNINFRDKKSGWVSSHLITIESSLSNNGTKRILLSETGQENVFLRGFLKNLFLRHSCYNCPVKPLKSGSDITIADYWGIQNVLPEFYDKKGISLVMVNTEKGKKIYGSLNKNDQETTYIETITVNSRIEKSVLLNKKRKEFFKKWQDVSLIPLIDKLTLDSLPKKIIKYLFRWSRKIFSAKPLFRKKCKS